MFTRREMIKLWAVGGAAALLPVSYKKYLAPRI